MTVATAVVVVAGWSAGTLLLARLRTPTAAGEAAHAGHADLAATTSVVIPARDEERSLPRLLDSLAAQAHPALEVIVVDDGSTDGTAAVAEAAGARLVSTDGPPLGWAGKPWACHLGTGAARGDRLLVLDADTWLAPDGVARLVGAHAALAPEGLLSVQPFHVTEAAYEQLSALCNVVSVMASGVAAPGARDVTVAFGPCLVTTPAALAAAGGYEAVRRESIEDIALARAYRHAGLPVRALGGGTTIAFRMYAGGIRSLVAGWTKNLAGGARRAPLLPTAGAVLWVVALLSVVLAAATRDGWWVAVAWAAFAVQLAWALRRLGRFRWWTWVAFPVPLVAFLVLFTASAVARGGRGKVRWRGRDIDVRAG